MVFVRVGKLRSGCFCENSCSSAVLSRCAWESIEFVDDVMAKQGISKAVTMDRNGRQSASTPTTRQCNQEELERALGSTADDPDRVVTLAMWMPVGCLDRKPILDAKRLARVDDQSYR